MKSILIIKYINVILYIFEKEQTETKYKYYLLKKKLYIWKQNVTPLTIVFCLNKILYVKTNDTHPVGKLDKHKLTQFSTISV